MLPGPVRGGAATGGPHQEAFTDQVRLADRFHGLGLFPHHGRQVVEADRSAFELLAQGGEHGDIQPVQAFLVDLIKFQSIDDGLGVDGLQTMDDPPVPDPS